MHDLRNSILKAHDPLKVVQNTNNVNASAVTLQKILMPLFGQEPSLYNKYFQSWLF